MSDDAGSRAWQFLTNHTQVLLSISRNPDVRIREVAEQVGITERAAQRILADLVGAGFVERQRRGRRNSYLVHRNASMLGHGTQDDKDVGGLLELCGIPDVSAPSSRRVGLQLPSDDSA